MIVASRTLYWLLPLVLVACWTASYQGWRASGGAKNASPLLRKHEQWYAGRDGAADAKGDIRAGRIRMYGADCDDAHGPYVTSAYRRILKDIYSVEWIPLFGGDVVPDAHVLPYMNRYNAVVEEYLKEVYGRDVMKRIDADARTEGELRGREAERWRRERAMLAEGQGAGAPQGSR